MNEPAGTKHLTLQGYLAHKKHPPPGILQQDYTLGHMVVVGGGALFYERGTPVAPALRFRVQGA